MLDVDRELKRINYKEDTVTLAKLFRPNFVFENMGKTEAQDLSINISAKLPGQQWQEAFTSNARISLAGGQASTVYFDLELPFHTDLPEQVSFRILQVNVLQEEFDNIVESIRQAICDPIASACPPGSPSSGELSEDLWLSDEKSWHLNKRLGSQMRGIFIAIDRLIRTTLNVEGPGYDHKKYISYQRNGRNCIFVRTFPNLLILVFPVKAGSMDKRSIAHQLLDIDEFEHDDSHAEKLSLPSSVNIVRRNEKTDRILIRIKEDFDINAPAFTGFLKQTATNFGSKEYDKSI